MEEELNLNMVGGSELNQKDLQDLGLIPKEDGTLETSSKEESSDTNITEQNKVDQPSEPSSSSEDIITDLLDPESVADNEDKNNDNPPLKSTVNHSNIFQLAKALKEEGVLSSISDEELNSIKSAADLVSAINTEVDSKLDSTTKRVKDALVNGIEPTKIQTYENAINYLDSINDEAINSDADESIKLRQQLIYQDFLNRGFDKDRAIKEVKKSIDAGTDIEDALEALHSNKEYFQQKYNNEINEAKNQSESIKQAYTKQAEDLRKSIIEDTSIYKDFNVNKNTREKIFNNMLAPKYIDDQTGEKLTEFTKYVKDNKEDYIKKIGLLFTLTDGFKNLNKLNQININKAKTKAIAELEKTLTMNPINGMENLHYVSGVNEVSESAPKYELA